MYLAAFLCGTILVLKYMHHYRLYESTFYFRLGLGCVFPLQLWHHRVIAGNPSGTTLQLVWE